MSRVAFVTGCTGQDGSYLTEFLLHHGYIVHGLVRRSSQPNLSRLEDIYKSPQDKEVNLHLHYGDITDSSCIGTLIDKIQPDEVYNLAGMSHVGLSFKIPEYTSQVNGIGALNLLEACRKLPKPVRIYQASTAEMFGGVTYSQDESTPFKCKSPYAISKLFAHNMAIHYREAYGMYITCGILFNHTSPRRSDTFIEQKIVKGAIGILYGRQKYIQLGNLYTRRDIGHAKDYIRAMYLMMIQNTPYDYVISTGKSVSIKEIVDYVFKKINLPLSWTGDGIDEIGWNMGRQLVLVDKDILRPTDSDNLQGCSTMAYNLLGWKPKYTLEMILDEMIEHERANYEEKSHMYHIKKFKAI